MIDRPPYPEAPLGDVCEVTLGLPVSRRAKRGLPTPVVRVRDLDDHVLSQRPTVMPLPLDPARIDSRRLREGDLLLTARAPVLRSSLVGSIGPDAVPDANLIVLRCQRDRLAPEVLWAWLQSRAGRHRLERISRVSTTTLALGAADVARLEVPLPPPPAQAQIAALVTAAEQAWAYGVRAAHERRAIGRAAAEALLSGRRRDGRGVER